MEEVLQRYAEKISSSVGGGILHNIAMSVINECCNSQDILRYGYFPPKKLGMLMNSDGREPENLLVWPKIGWSTDMDAAIYADIMGVKTVINLKC